MIPLGINDSFIMIWIEYKLRHSVACPILIQIKKKTLHWTLIRELYSFQISNPCRDPMGSCEKQNKTNRNKWSIIFEKYLPSLANEIPNIATINFLNSQVFYVRLTIWITKIADNKKIDIRTLKSNQNSEIYTIDVKI